MLLGLNIAVSISTIMTLRAVVKRVIGMHRNKQLNNNK